MRRIIAILLVCASVGIALLARQPIFAVEDLEPPQVLDVKMEETMVDSSQGNILIFATIWATDDLSGIRQVNIVFRPDSNPASGQNVQFHILPRGYPAPDNVYRVYATLNQYAARGVWRASLAWVIDNANNSKYISEQTNSEEFDACCKGAWFSNGLTNHVFVPAMP